MAANHHRHPPLADIIHHVADVMSFVTVSHPARPKGWDITWGAQVDPRVVPLTSDAEITDVAVASYLAKYATKSTEAVGPLAVRITAGNLRLYGNPASHQGRLIRAAWQLGSHPHPDFQALRRWAHMLGHARISVTLEVYTDSDSQRDALTRMSDRLFGPAGA